MRRAYIIGIAGKSASGKTTISEELKLRLADYRVKVIHMDEYYKEESMRPRIKGISDGREYVDDNHPMALDLERCCQDAAEAAVGNWDVIIVEGIFALWEERICALSDLKIYVDCDPDERISRRIARHLSFGQELEEITERYVQAVSPRQKEFVEPTKWKADLILNGFLKSGRGVSLVAEWLDKTLRESGAAEQTKGTTFP